jgi:superfamily II DNA or RNA helicase
MRPGIYERLIREGEEAELQRLETDGRAWVDGVSESVRRHLLLDEIASRIPELLDLAASSSGDAVEQAQSELRLIAKMLSAARDGEEARGLMPLPALNLKLLRAIHEPQNRPVLPRTGFSKPWLFTSGKGEPSLYSELRAELETAERLDLLVSFIKKAGVRKLADVFQRVTAADAQGNTRLQVRILTTTYLGATDRSALDQLAQYPGVQVRVSLDGQRERLHAKAWIFERANGFGTAFVGSANLSKSALIDGIEWTVKIAQARDAALFESARANFETLWNDPEFSPYDPNDSEHRAALDRALETQRGAPAGQVIALRTWFDLQPKGFQQVMLDRLAHERAHGRNRNLLVAATGTGKTVVSAFDYRRLCVEHGGRPRLLFIAHQRQILEQARATFRHVLRDGSFGDLLDGSTESTAHEHLFAMIQTLNSRDLVRKLGGGYWTMVIVDEAHHLPAASFQAVLRSLQPSILLGLTATPERLDGQPLTEFFDSRPDGSPAWSLRLWDALDQQLLSPFEYYATADTVDFRGDDWGRAGEMSQVAQVLTGSEIRARSVAESIERYVDDLAGMRALAFCTSVDHARFMAEVFSKLGLAAVAVSAEDSHLVREQVVDRLQKGELQVVCSVNLFNEGVDIPAVNTLFLLRPTQSPVVFQQQIGRGLRHYPGKSCCLVLDYVGLYGQEFRFDILYRSLTGLSRRQLGEAVEKGFGQLPPGCHLQLEKVARERVLENLRQSLRVNARRLRSEVLAWAAGRTGTLRLADFLRDQGIELSDLYENGRSWQGLLRAAGLPHVPFGPEDEMLLERAGRLLHANDPRLLRAWIDWISSCGEGEDDPSLGLAGVAGITEQGVPPRAPLMLAHQIYHETSRVLTVPDFRAILSKNAAFRSELTELLAYLDEASDNPGHPLIGVPAEWPLSLHGRYSRLEILAALGYASETRRPVQREGVLALTGDRLCVLFVTLDKSEGFHDRVKYRDYAISPELFAWETQNQANPGNRLGQRFTESPGNGWRFFLFVRETPDFEFAALGEVRLERWERCEKGPIPIVWRLITPLSAALYRSFSILRDA